MQQKLPVMALGLLVWACSSTTSTTPTGSSGSSGSAASTPVSTADCAAKCEPKAVECGAPSADAKQTCAGICDGATQEQVTCLQAKSCNELVKAETLSAACPKSSSGSSGSNGSSGSSGSNGGKQLGDACTCAGVSASSEGLCSGTDEECSSGLSCLYPGGSSGKGTCVAARCCDTTSACDDDSSLLKPCSAGTCKKTALGYFCSK